MIDHSVLKTNIPPAIATSGLAKRYSHHFVIKDLNLTVPSGAVLGLLGMNGSGKSSLIKLLATAEVATRGQIYFHGDRLLSSINLLRLRKNLGYLPEHEQFDLSLLVIDYLSYFASLYQISPSQIKIRIYEVLEWVNLAHKHKNLIGDLSQGEQKRLSLARAIIHEPTILLLDNPFPGLDKPAQDQLEILLATLKEAAITVVISATNPLHLVKICTEIKIIEYGYLTKSMDIRTLNLEQLSPGNFNFNKSDLDNLFAQFSFGLNTHSSDQDSDNKP